MNEHMCFCFTEKCIVFPWPHIGPQYSSCTSEKHNIHNRWTSWQDGSPLIYKYNVRKTQFHDVYLYIIIFTSLFMVRPSPAYKNISEQALSFSDRCRLFHVPLPFNICLVNEPRLTLCVCLLVCVWANIERPDFHAREDGKNNKYDKKVRPVNVQQDSTQVAAYDNMLRTTILDHRG